jgi:hypothetical protein
MFDESLSVYVQQANIKANIIATNNKIDGLISIQLIGNLFLDTI